MAVTSYLQALQLAEALPRDEQLRLIRELAERSADADEQATDALELCGLGQEIWQHLDAQQYVHDERASWNG